MDVLMFRKDRMEGLLAGLLAEYRVIAPVVRAGELRFDRLSSAAEATLDYRNTVKAPKSVMFPPTERLLRFRQRLDRYNEIEAAACDDTPTLIWGLRPCDARSYLLLDRVFTAGPYLDPYYRSRREHTLVVSLACDHPRQTCFCHAFGSGPYDRQGSDALLREAGDAYLIEAASARGAEWLAGLELAAADEAHLAQAAAIEAQAVDRLADIEPVAGIETLLPALFDSGMWREVSEKCLACGTCTYNCPTCHCFNIEDRVLADGGERVRAWDACMYSTFTLHASGHNPRPDQAARWRQRTLHKFDYLPRNVGLYGCVGCGRCIQSCPVRLDIRAVLRRARQESAVQAAAKAQEG